MTLSRRVVLATSAALGAVVVLLSIFAYYLVKHELYSRLDLTLDGRATELAPTVLAGRSAFRTVIAAPGELVQTLSSEGLAARPPYQVTSSPPVSVNGRSPRDRARSPRPSRSRARACES